ncbi:hypothetical protein OHR86_18085 [Streptomyces sp. NBC_00441]|uniref:hypothetical protein n=1 Tax=Streptomyces sp. NBC_00441 TaxID=2975742 RepID=UPI002E2DB6DC|nr:hypothetical protein [Streptomyces sp. NBC_00441]
MRRFELSEWKRSPRLTDLRNTVVELLAEGRHRTALDETLRGLRRDPENPDGLFLALSVLAQSRTTRLSSPEPLTETQQWNALLAPITTACSACDSRWYSTHAVLFTDNDVQIHPTNPIGLQCQKCRYTLCRDCLKAQRPTSYTLSVDAPEAVAASCANSDCGGRGLSAPVLPTGRPDVTPMDPEAIEGVLVVRDGPIRPTTDDALAVVTRFLPLIPDDAPLLHIRRARPGTMSDASGRDGLAQSLLLDLEREGVLAPASWGRSRRMHILAGPGGDADYLIVPVQRSHLRVPPAAPHPASRPGTYTYLLQILPLRGGWATLRDPGTGDFHEGTFGALSAPAESLPGLAQDIIKRFERMGRSRRVMFFEGDRTQQSLSTDDVYGIVTEGSTSLSPYSEGP